MEHCPGFDCPMKHNCLRTQLDPNVEQDQSYVNPPYYRMVFPASANPVYHCDKLVQAIDDDRIMDVAIIARERSSRYPQKHLLKINGKTLIENLIEMFYNFNANRVFLATGPYERNKTLCETAESAGAIVFAPKYVEEFDLLGRLASLYRTYNLNKLILHSGDIAFPDFRFCRLVWDVVNPPSIMRAATAHPHALGSEQMVSCAAAPLYLEADDRIPKMDPRRESPGPLLSEDYPNFGISTQDPTKTPVKVSIDYPFEGVIAKTIVDYLGRWPSNPSDLEEAYQGIKSI